MSISTSIPRFIVVGCINTIVDYSLFNIAIICGISRSGWALSIVSTLCVLIAATVSLYLNRSWTFKLAGYAKTPEVFRFAFVTVISLVINGVIIRLLIPLDHVEDTFYIEANLAKLCGGLFSAIWNYLIYSQWVFKSPESPNHLQGTIFTESPELNIDSTVSIIIPAYNEEKRILQPLKRLAEELPSHFPVEIIVVNDGSSDSTGTIISGLSNAYPQIRLESLPCNKGKGAAVKAGVLASTGSLVIYTDADGTFESGHIICAVEELMKGAPIVVGTRCRRQGHGTDGEPFFRCIMGRIFNGLVRVLLLPGISDSQCGLKGMSGGFARSAFGRINTDGFAFDVELLAIARSMKVAVKEIPVSAKDCPGSHVDPIRSPIRMAMDVARITFSSKGQKAVDIAVCGTCLLLFFTAFIIRLPWLQLIPRYFDEIREVQLGLEIARGKILPLHNVAWDIGAMHNYILAGLFRIFGPNPISSRLYVAVTGALTVPLLFATARMAGGWFVGLTAGLALTVNGMHILVTHQAWANCTTPFYVMAAILALLISEQKKDGRWLVAAGFLWALALQTHSSVIVFMSGALAYVTLSGYIKRTRFGRGWYVAAIAAFLIGYSNMIAFNIMSRGGSLLWYPRKAYSTVQDPSFPVYLHNAAAMGMELVRSVGSIYHGHTHYYAYLTDPAFVATITLLLLGCIICYRKGFNLPLYVIGAGFLVIPWINRRYDFYVNARYIMTLVVLSMIPLALGIERVFGWLCSCRPKVRPAAALFIVVVAFGGVLKVGAFYSYCSSISYSNDSNLVPLRAVKIMEAWSSEPLVKSVPASIPQIGTESILLVDKGIPFFINPFPVMLELEGYRSTMVNEGKWQKTLSSLKSGRKVIALVCQEDEPYVRKVLSRVIKAKSVELKIRTIFPPYQDSPKPHSVGTRRMFVLMGIR